MKPLDYVMLFTGATLILSALQALSESVVVDFVAGFFESVGALFTKRGRADLRLYGFMGWKRR